MGKNTILLYADENNKISLIKTSKTAPGLKEKKIAAKSEENENTLVDIISHYPVSKKYVEFCDTLIKLNSKTVKNIIIVKHENKFSVLYGEFSYVLKHLITYEPENPKVFEFFEKYFNCKLETTTSKLQYSYRVADLYNNFAWGLPPSVLEVLVAAILCEEDGVPFYNRFTIKKHNGKDREIFAPDERIKAALRKVNHILQIAYDSRNEDFQVAYKAGKSILDNARPHKDNQYVMKLDISNFFPSCKREMVLKYINFLFKGAEADDELMNRFLDIITIDGGLFIGSPVSGTLANVIISKAVLYISNICKKWDVAFTVYADDMTFSSYKYLHKDFVENLFETAFKEFELDDSLKINTEKTHGGSKTNRHITGVSFNQESQTVCRRARYRELRVILNRLSKGEAIDHSIQTVRGRIAFMTMVDESEKVINLLTKYKDVVEKHHLYTFK